MKQNWSLFICLIFLCAGQAFADGVSDSPWPMIGGDPGHTCRGNSVHSATNVLKWKFQGDGNMGSPSIGNDGTVYVGSNDINDPDSKGCGYLYALNPDGSMKWKYRTERSLYNTVPAIGDDRTIYIGSQDSFLYALEPDGTLKWKFQTEYDIISSPVIGYNGLIYISSGDGFLYVLNSEGELQWKYKLPGLNSNFPAVGKDGTAYICGGDSFLYALNPDGTLKWGYPNIHDMTSPSFCEEDSTIYVGTTRRDLAAFNLDGTLKWSSPLGENANIDASPAIAADGTIYIGSRDFFLYAVKPDGSPKWKFKTGGLIYDAAAIGNDGCIYVPSSDQYIYAINPDGSLRWKYAYGDPNAQTAETFSTVSTPIIGGDGTLYFGTGYGSSFFGNECGYLYALAPEKQTSVKSEQISFIIKEPYPNPFNPSTTIAFSLNAPSQVKIAVYSINGQKVAALVDGLVSAGTHSVKFNGSNLASGVYFYRFESSGLRKTGKMLLLK